VKYTRRSPIGGLSSLQQNGGYAERALHSSIVDPRFQSNAQLIADVRPREATPLLDWCMAWSVAILITSCTSKGVL